MKKHLFFFLLFCATACGPNDDPAKNGGRDGGTLPDGGEIPKACDTERWPVSGCPADKVCENNTCSKPFRASIEFKFPKPDGVQLTGKLTLHIADCDEFVGSLDFLCIGRNSRFVTCEGGETCKFEVGCASHFKIEKVEGNAAKYVFADKGEPLDYLDPNDLWYRLYESETDAKVDWDGEAEYGLKVNGIYKIQETGQNEHVTSYLCRNGQQKTCIWSSPLSNRTFHGVFEEGSTEDGEISEDTTRISRLQVASPHRLDWHYTFVRSGNGE